MSKKAFILDDDEYILELVTIALKNIGLTVLSASDGMSALEQISKEVPDIIIMDIMTPKMSGLQLCDELNKSDNLKNIPKIFMTASSKFNEDEIKGRHGVAELIIKPFNTKDIVNAVSKVLDIK